MRLDNRSKFPSGMEEYLEMYEWHFNKKMYKWAMSMLDGEKHTKEQIDELFKKHNIKLENNFGYDCYYVVNLIKNKFKTSIEDDIHLVKFVKEYLKCFDTFTQFYAHCIAKGIPIIWEDMI